MKTKRINFSLSSDDINAIMCSLSVLPAYVDPNEPTLINPDFIQSIIVKLSQHSPLNRNDNAMIKTAIEMAYAALCSNIDAPQDVLENLRPYFFTINKLYQSFGNEA